MDIVVAIIGLAMLIAVAAYIAQPLAGRSRALPSSESPRDKLLAERDALYVTIRDLDFDFQTGKLLETDYRSMREKHVARGVEILKQLDATPEVGGQRSTVADEIEAAVKVRRQSKASDDEIEAAVRARRQASIRDPKSETLAPALSPKGTSASAGVRNQKCPNCGRPVDLTDRFCGKCGAALTVEASR